MNNKLKVRWKLKDTYKATTVKTADCQRIERNKKTNHPHKKPKPTIPSVKQK